MLEDEFIYGTASSAGSEKSFLYCKPGEIGVYTTRVSQTAKEEDMPTLENAYAIVGIPVSEEYVEKFRTRKKVGMNWGVVILPKSFLKGTDVNSAKGVVEEQADKYFVAGILLAEHRRWDARRFVSDEHNVVFASLEDFPGLRLKD